MKKILLLSDTHNYMDEAILKHVREADEVWHSGDIGSLALLEQLQGITTVRAVFGNIDGQDIRCQTSKIAKFECEGARVLMAHIGGYPGRYDSSVFKQILEYRPDIFISGHSHILKVMPDPKLGLLHMNPGAIGKTGYHVKRTMLRFEIDNATPRNLALIEYDRW